MMMELNAQKVELSPKYRPQKAAPALIWPRLVHPNTPADQNYRPKVLKTNLQMHLRIKTYNKGGSKQCTIETYERSFETQGLKDHGVHCTLYNQKNY